MKTKELARGILKKFGRMALRLSVAAFPLYTYCIKVPVELTRNIWPNVSSVEEAYQILEEERKKLGIEPLFC